VCFGFINYMSHQGDRAMFAADWRFAGGCISRSRRRFSVLALAV
jgi:hypothetical protein